MGKFKDWSPKVKVRVVRDRAKVRSGLFSIRHRETGHYFVGYGRDVKRVLNFHMSRLRDGIHPNLLLQEEYRQFGEWKFWYGVILYCEPSEMIRYRQRLRYDAWYNPLYEHLDRRKLPMSEEHKQNISLALKGKKKRPMSDITKEKISITQTWHYIEGDGPLDRWRSRSDAMAAPISEVTKGVYDEKVLRGK